MQELKLHSQHLDEELSLPVYCSKPITPLYKHLVIIAQDGQDYFMFGKIGRVIDELGIRAVVIGVPYRNVSDRYEKYHPNGKNAKRTCAFLRTNWRRSLMNIFRHIKWGQRAFSLAIRSQALFRFLLR